MKTWLIFGSGLVLGAMAGAFLSAFLLFDDLTAKPSSPSAPTVATAKPHKVKPSPSVPAPEVKPTAVVAEAVELDSLPPAENEVIATARRDDDGAKPTAHEVR